jgi:hypothetical protein
MSIGILTLKLHLPGSFSLKDKRRIMKSITTQIRRDFNVSIAEIQDQGLWQSATIGIACISTDSQYINGILSKITDFIAKGRFEVEVIGQEMEILPGP